MTNIDLSVTTASSWITPNLSGFSITSDAPVSYPVTELYDNDEGCPQINCTPVEFMAYVLGPQTLPLHKALMITIIFGGIFITGILGNVLVCMVIIRHSSMHTATNYYLFSLAVSDLLYLLLGLPIEVFLYWHQYPYLFGQPFCKMRAFVSEACSYVSVFTIVAFSMERFLAICHPLHVYTMSGFERASKIITALWILSFLGAIPFGIKSEIEYLTYPIDKSIIMDSAYCSIDVQFTEKFPLFEISFCIFFLIPMILIIVLYGRMGLQIRSRATEELGVQQGSRNRDSRSSQKKKKAVIRMLAAVVITFFVCWFPFHLQRLWYLYAKEYENYYFINECLFSIAGLAYYVSCTINPIVYNVMSRRYRVAFKEILCGKKAGAFYNNGFAREQSSFIKAQSSFRHSSISREQSSFSKPRASFRHSSIATTNLGGNTQYSRVHSNGMSSDFLEVNTTNIVIVLGNNSSDCQKETVAKNPEELSVEETETLNE